jgi:hypothetical protein
MENLMGLVVFCGKFLLTSHVSAIKKILQSGGWVYFPWGKPIYDECLNTIGWPKTINSRHEDREIRLTSLSEGRIWEGLSLEGLSLFSWEKFKIQLDRIVSKEERHDDTTSSQTLGAGTEAKALPTPGFL